MFARGPKGQQLGVAEGNKPTNWKIWGALISSPSSVQGRALVEGHSSAF